MKPLPKEQVQGVAQMLLALLSDEQTSIPGNMVDAVSSGKSLFRGLLSGELEVCQVQSAPPAGKPEKVVEPEGPPDAS